MIKIHDLIAENAQLLAGYNYAYFSSTGLFLGLKNYKIIPNDFDIALNWKGKNKKELFDLYKIIKSNSFTKKIKFVVIEDQKIGSVFVKKHQRISKSSPIVDRLLKEGNIKLMYMYKDMIVELFPEQEGNGVTNIDIMSPKIHEMNINDTNVMVLDTLEIAKRYVINLIDEVMNQEIQNIQNPEYKHKDAIRLNNIIHVLYTHNLDYSPKGLIKFVDDTIKELEEKIPTKKRSLFMNKIIKSYPFVRKNLCFLQKLYDKLNNNYSGKKEEISFVDFHKELKREVVKLYDVVSVYKHDILKNLSINKTSFMKRVRLIECEKIQEYVSRINLKSKINGFAYFYEFHAITDMIKKM